MDLDHRRALYIAAAIQGMLTAEQPDGPKDETYIAHRAVVIADTAVGLQEGTLGYDDEGDPAEGEADPETPAEGEADPAASSGEGLPTA